MSFWFIFLTLAGFFFSAVFSGVETGGYMINRVRLRYRSLNHRHSARMLERVLRDPHLFIFTVLIGQNICVYLVSTLVTNQYMASGINEAGPTLIMGFLPWNAETAATVTLMLPLFVFGEVVPKELFRKRADFLMYRMADLLRFFMVLFHPVTAALRRLFCLLTRGRMEDGERDLLSLTPEGLREFFSDSEREGVLSSHQNCMVENVVSMHCIPVKDLMRPIKELPKLPAGATVADLRRMTARKKSVYVVLMEQHRAVGVVSLYPVLQRALNDDEKIRPYAADILQICETRNLKTAFYRLRRNPLHLAVVVSAHERPAGFVRLEDISRFIAAQ